jgi:thiamine biosynthesis lipoprotein
MKRMTHPWERLAFGAGAVTLAACLLGGCGVGSDERVTLSFTGMGTVGSIVIRGDDAGNAGAMTACATATVAALEDKLSIFKPGSDLARINAADGREGVEVAPDTRELIDLALRASRDSGGAFDMTVGPLMALWGFRGSNLIQRLPTDLERAAALESVGYRHVSISGRTVRVDRAGIRLDAGGIGKGYAVDKGWTALRAAGWNHFLINMGGNMRAAGRPVPNRAWSVGVRNPFQTDELLGNLRLEDGMAVATSGHYEKFVTIDDVRYAHIMDPRSGLPVQGMAGVTVAAPSAGEADAMSTTMFVMGPKEGVAMLARTGRHVEALFVPDRKPIEIWVTPGMAKLFEPIPGLVVRVCQPEK